MTAVCAEQRSPAEAQGRGDNGRGGAVTWRYDVCQGPVTLAEFDHDCRMTRWYVRGVGVAEGIGDVVAEVDVSGESPKPHYYLYNHRGDVLVVLNPDGAANSTFRYDAFGNYYQMTGPFTPRYTFSTKEYLPAAGLYLYQYRVYDPVAGRWTQRDPIDYQDSVNLYQFCGNNPVCNHDTDGRTSKSVLKTLWKMSVGGAKSAWKALCDGKSGAEVVTAACDGARNAGLKAVGKEIGISPVATAVGVSTTDQTLKGNLNEQGVANVSKATAATAVKVGVTVVCPPAGAVIEATTETYDLTVRPVVDQWCKAMDDPQMSETRQRYYRQVQLEREEAGNK